MPILRTLFATALLSLCLSLGAVQAAEPPSSEAVQRSLDKIADRKLPEADQKALQAVLQQTLNQLNNKADYEQRLIDLKQQLANAPRQNSENQKELERLKATKVVPVAQRYANLDVHGAYGSGLDGWRAGLGYQYNLSRRHRPLYLRAGFDYTGHGGVALLIDYGFPAHEYYLPQRAEGTLMCHYRHHAHGDPFYLPGLQDITAHVDFSAVARTAVASGLDVLCYTSQAAFLIDAGITDLLQRIPASDRLRYLPRANEVQKLTSPAEMGELFKVIALGTRVELPPQFGRNDRSHRL